MEELAEIVALLTRARQLVNDVRPTDYSSVADAYRAVNGNLLKALDSIAFIRLQQGKVR